MPTVSPVILPLFKTGQRAATGDLELIPAPGAQRRIVIDAVVVAAEVATANLILLKCNGAAFFRFQAAASIGSSFYGTNLNWRMGINANVAINISVAAAVGYSIAYHVEDVAQ